MATYRYTMAMASRYGQLYDAHNRVSNRNGAVSSSAIRPNRYHLGKDKDMDIKVNGNLFALVHRVISSEETRYYLNGVHIEPHESGVGCYMVATDGHRMLVAYDRHGRCEKNAIVAVSKQQLAAMKFKRAKNQSGQVAALAVDGNGSVSVHQRIYAAKCMPENLPVPSAIIDDVTSVTNGSTIIDGTFPDWRNVLPKGDGEADVACFDGRYISDFGDISTGVAELFGSHNIMSIYSHDAGSPALIRFGDAPLFGVLMPRRKAPGDDLRAMPDWLGR